MKKYLLPKEGMFYKANLHCHSTFSDGKLTPAQLKEVYKAKGYSVVAFTDHDIMVAHQELADEEFLPLNGYEMEVNEPKTSEMVQSKVCHMCLVALEPDNLKQVCWHREKYIPKAVQNNTPNYKELVQIYDDEPDYERIYSPEGISDMMRRGREQGFFVTYNHPTWSQETYEQYTGYQNMHAMEICNYECMCLGYEEYNARVYDEMLRAGKKIYCIGADDTHGIHAVGGAYIMIKADKLEYRTITRALEEGRFYASQGPEIRELWVEDGELHVKTSDAERILFNCGNRKAKQCTAAEGESVNEATFALTEQQIYVRVTVIDHKGKIANSNAYFISDILK